MNCLRCHTCGAKLKKVLDGEEWCPNCETYRRYRSHGWAKGACDKGNYECPPWAHALNEREKWLLEQAMA